MKQLILIGMLLGTIMPGLRAQGQTPPPRPPVAKEEPKEEPKVATGERIEIPDVGFSILPPNGWMVHKNAHGSSLLFEAPKQPNQIYQPTIQVMVFNKLRYIDEVTMKEYGDLIVEKFGKMSNRVTGYHLRDAAIQRLETGDPSILYYTEFQYDDVPIMQMHILISSATNHFVMTYTDIAKVFEDESSPGLAIAYTSMHSAQLDSRPPWRWRGFVMGGGAILFVILGWFTLRFLRARRMAKLGQRIEDEDNKEITRDEESQYYSRHSPATHADSHVGDDDWASKPKSKAAAKVSQVHSSHFDEDDEPEVSDVVPISTLEKSLHPARKRRQEAAAARPQAQPVSQQPVSQHPPISNHQSMQGRPAPVPPPAHPGQPGQGMNPSQPMHPGMPTQGMNPSQPMHPGMPAQGMNPGMPQHAVNPSQSMNNGMPVQGHDPAQAMHPGIPGAPTPFMHPGMPVQGHDPAQAMHPGMHGTSPQSMHQGVPVQGHDPAQAMHQGMPGNPSQSMNNGVPVQGHDPAQAMHPGIPGNPSHAAHPGMPGNAMNPSQSMPQGVPVQGHNPALQGMPAPSQPVHPGTPSHAQNPSHAINPGMPVHAVNPQGMQGVNPSQPMQPGMPANSMDSRHASHPAAPAQPVNPQVFHPPQSAHPGMPAHSQAVPSQSNNSVNTAHAQGANVNGMMPQPAGMQAQQNVPSAFPHNAANPTPHAAPQPPSVPGQQTSYPHAAPAAVYPQDHQPVSQHPFATQGAPQAATAGTSQFAQNQATTANFMPNAQPQVPVSEQPAYVQKAAAPAAQAFAASSAPSFAASAPTTVSAMPQFAPAPAEPVSEPPITASRPHSSQMGRKQPLSQNVDDEPEMTEEARLSEILPKAGTIETSKPKRKGLFWRKKTEDDDDQDEGGEDKASWNMPAAKKSKGKSEDEDLDNDGDAADEWAVAANDAGLEAPVEKDDDGSADSDAWAPEATKKSDPKRDSLLNETQGPQKLVRRTPQGPVTKDQNNAAVTEDGWNLSPEVASDHDEEDEEEVS